MEYLNINLSQVCRWVWRWKNFENRSTFGEVMGKSLVSCVFDLCTRSVYFHVGGSSAVSVALLSCLAVSPAPFMDFFLNECNRWRWNLISWCVGAWTIWVKYWLVYELQQWRNYAKKAPHHSDSECMGYLVMDSRSRKRTFFSCDLMWPLNLTISCDLRTFPRYRRDEPLCHTCKLKPSLRKQTHSAARLLYSASSVVANRQFFHFAVILRIWTIFFGRV